MLPLFLSLLVPAAAGLLLAHLFWPCRKPWSAAVFLNAPVALGIGLGLYSCVFFLCLLAQNTSAKGIVIVDAAMLGCLGAAFGIRRRYFPACSEAARDVEPKWWARNILVLGFVGVLACGVLSFACLTLMRPHGGWDAWAIWNLRARFLARSGVSWRDAFSLLLGWSHPDYPLLIPGIVARSWKYAGIESVGTPAVIAMVFTFATVWLITSSVAFLKGTSQGLLAGMLLLGNSMFLSQGAAQYSDVPLGFFMLSTMVLFCLHERSPEKSRGMLVLAGITTGLAAWTKNEGILFLVAIVIARISASMHLRDRKTTAAEALPFALGLVPVLAVVLVFKTWLAPPGDFLASQGSGSTVDRLMDFSRYVVTGKAYLKEMFRLPLLLPVVYALIMGVRVGEREKRGVATLLVALLLMMSGYFLVYVVTPNDLEWHLSNSLGRLVMQLWPSFLLGCFLLARIPESLLVAGQPAAPKGAPARDRRKGKRNPRRGKE